MKQNGARQLPIQDFLTAHGKTLRGFAAEAGMPLATASDLVKGKREPRTSNVNKVLAWARTLDPSVTYEQLFAPEQNAARGIGIELKPAYYRQALMNLQTIENTDGEQADLGLFDAVESA